MDVGGMSRNTGAGQEEEYWDESRSGANFDMNALGEGKGFMKGKGKGAGAFMNMGRACKWERE